MGTYGFHYRYRLGGGAPTIRDILVTDTGTYTAGDLVNLETGEADIAATNDAAIIGAVLETATTVDSTTRIKCVTDWDAVYGVTDATARLLGATLDMAGTTATFTIAPSNNIDLLVVEESTATEETRVIIAPGEHYAQ